MILIRKAVGAIIQFKTQYILIHKVQLMDFSDIPQKILGQWDFVKGGVKSEDLNIKEALFRELVEETGSLQYKIIKEFPESLHFEFPPLLQSRGITHQKTRMFLVEFLGELSDLKPIDKEIDQIEAFSAEDAVERLSHAETKAFFCKYVLNAKNHI